MRVKNRWAAVAVPLSLMVLLTSPLAKADPFNVESVADDAIYSSPFQGYVNDEDIEMGGWVKANERVGEIGGWRTYLKEAQESMDAPEQTEKGQQSMPHGGHGANHASPNGAKQ